MKSRIETDALGEVRVPGDKLWGAQTQRAVENFRISGIGFTRELIEAMGLVKLAAAESNVKCGEMKPELGEKIGFSAQQVMQGEKDDHFPLDIFQTGSGTSLNMNVNEVIANMVNISAGEDPGSKFPVHPNDHVNMGQSSNDVIPTAIHIAVAKLVNFMLLPEMERMKDALENKTKEFRGIIKLGRTHLQDAAPVAISQEFGGYAEMILKGISRIRIALDGLLELPLGGTAVGTGLNRHRDFPARAICKIAEMTGIPFREAEDHFEAQSSKDALVFMSGALKTLAVSLTKIANDIRWSGSGPYGGIGELILPEVQPGSSIMPGKINPVIPEALLQVCAQVMGNDVIASISGQSGNFQLNTMMPLLGHTLIQSVLILSNGIGIFRGKCISGLKVDRQRCSELLEKSLAMVTALNPVIGYDKAVEIAREAFKTGKTLRALLLEKDLLTPAKIDELLDPAKMIGD